jgi:hypothetical protein
MMWMRRWKLDGWKKDGKDNDEAEVKQEVK